MRAGRRWRRTQLVISRAGRSRHRRDPVDRVCSFRLDSRAPARGHEVELIIPPRSPLLWSVPPRASVQIAISTDTPTRASSPSPDMALDRSAGGWVPEPSVRQSGPTRLLPISASALLRRVPAINKLPQARPLAHSICDRSLSARRHGHPIAAPARSPPILTRSRSRRRLSTNSINHFSLHLAITTTSFTHTTVPNRIAMLSTSLLAALSLGALASAAPTAPMKKRDDIDTTILQYALTLEHLEFKFCESE